MNRIYCWSFIYAIRFFCIPIICDDDGILAIPLIAIRDKAKATKQGTEQNKTKITVCIK